jgi:hypothetical protein
MADVTAQVKTAIAISNLFDAIATKIFQQAKSERKKGNLTYVEYKQVAENYYLPLMSYATKIHIDTDNALTDAMSGKLDQIKDATTELSTAAKKIAKAEDIFQALTFVLASAAAVASFIAAPSPATAAAALSSISGAVGSINDIAQD